MNFLNEVRKNKDELIKSLINLLQIDTVLVEQPENKEAPFGEGIKEALLYVLQLGESMGFKTKNVDNIAGHIEYGEGEEIIGVLCHLDVVPAGDGWRYPPFSGTVEDDKIFARGALDDKGPLMSSLYALKVLKDSNVKINKRIRLIIGTDEETDWRGINRYLEVCEMPTLGFSPDAEFPIIYGEKGIMSIDITSHYHDDKLISLNSGDRYNVVPEKAVAVINDDLTKHYEAFLNNNHLKGKTTVVDGYQSIELIGKGAHAMEPKNGVNALVNLACFLNQYLDNPLIKFIGEKLTDSRFKDLELDFNDKEMGDLTVNVAVGKINQDGGKVGLNLRYPINWDKDAFVSKLQKIAKEYKLDVDVIKNSNPHFVDKNSELVKTLHQAYIMYTGDESTPLLTIGGGTYARALKNAVAFGMLMPGRPDVVHEVDEYIFIADLMTSTAIYATAMAELGK
jgi:succinyl-diaminopimelate desuccinylase